MPLPPTKRAISWRVTTTGKRTRLAKRAHSGSKPAVDPAPLGGIAAMQRVCLREPRQALYARLVGAHRCRIAERQMPAARPHMPILSNRLLWPFDPTPVLSIRNRDH